MLGAAVKLLTVALVLVALVLALVLFLVGKLLAAMGLPSMPVATAVASFASFAARHWFRINSTRRTYRVLVHLLSPPCEYFLERETLVVFLLLALFGGLNLVTLCSAPEEGDSNAQWFRKMLLAGHAVVVEGDAPGWMMTSSTAKLTVEVVDDYRRILGRTLGQLIRGGTQTSTVTLWVNGGHRQKPSPSLLRIASPQTLLQRLWGQPEWMRQMNWLVNQTTWGPHYPMHADELQIVTPPPPHPPHPTRR